MTQKVSMADTVKAGKKARSNPAQKAALEAAQAELAALKAKYEGFIAQQARMTAHLQAAQQAKVSAQATLVGKISADGELGYKLQGIRTAGVQSKAERSVGAQSIFTVVNAQNRQLESMVRYLWAVRNNEHAAVLAAHEPMAQGWETVKAAMSDTNFTDVKGIKKAAFIQAVSDAMVATIWAK